jgi:hypothetical protein
MTDNAAIVWQFLAGCSAPIEIRVSLDALVAERDEARLHLVTVQTALAGWASRAEAAEAERDEAHRLLREVVKADQQDAQMGYPIPGDSCLGAFIGLVLMEYLDKLAPSATGGERVCMVCGEPADVSVCDRCCE